MAIRISRHQATEFAPERQVSLCSVSLPPGSDVTDHNVACLFEKIGNGKLCTPACAYHKTKECAVHAYTLRPHDYITARKKRNGVYINRCVCVCV